MHLKHIFFDLDRTLWDFERNNEETFRDLFLHFNLYKICNCEFERFYEYYIIINATLWDAYRNGSLQKEVLMTKRFSIVLEYFNSTHRLSVQEISDYYLSNTIKQKRLLPYSIELLEYLKSKSYKMYIITNGFKEVQYRKLADAGLSVFFDYIFISEEIGYQKPHKAIFDFAMQKTMASPHECVMIGDDYEVDICGANLAGMETIYCNFTHRIINGISPKPSYEVKSLKEITKIL